MLTIDDLTYRIGARALFDAASATISEGWKVGMVGRNGTGKSTLLKLIGETVAKGDGKGDNSIRIARGARMGFVAQEVAASAESLISVVLSADTERAALMAEAETATDPTRIGDIHMRLADIEAWSAEARASEILVGLGFKQSDMDRPCSEFSGGWRMRAALAGILFSTPDLLLLDEPTNYLDLEGAAWLEGYLRKYPNTVLIVSHDRELLNRSVTHILALKHGKLAVHPGNYDTYMRKEAEKAALAMGMKAKQDAEKERLQSFVDRFRATASKSRQAQSRVKMLAKMQDIAVPLAERTTPFKFESPEKASSPLFELVGADLGYAPGQPVLKNVTLRLDHDDRIVVVGPNGQGKTTLVKSIGARLGLLAGQRMGSKSIKVGYFSQDQLDELHAGETVLDHVRTLTPQLSEAQRRSIAAQMGFGQEKIDTKVEKLSGGEKVRLLLGLTAFQKPHVLILDEPTSHLDIDSREALIHALNDYAGAVLLITHDVYLAEATADRLWLVNNGRAAPYEGDISDYRALVMDADRGGGSAAAGAASDVGAPQSSKAARREAAAARQSLAPLKRRIEDAEKHLEMCRADIAKIDRQLADPDLYTGNVHKVAQLNKRRADTLRHADAAEEEWLAASEAYEAGIVALASEDA